MEFATKSIWVGQEADKTTGATITPIYQTSTFTHEEIGVHKGYEYTRSGNPNRTALETCVASLEEGKHGLAFSSGLAAEHAVISILKPGDHVIACEDIYGGTFRLLTEVFEHFNISTTFVDMTNHDELKKSLRKETRMIWLESPTNPLLKIFDIAAIAEISNKQDALLVVDNTFATPYFQKPLKLGAHIVVHSTTKYINGHSDVIGGIVILNDDSNYEKIKFIQNSVGAVPSPFDCWLTLRGLKTLAVRMKQHQENAFKVAYFLQHHNKVDAVYFPGLPTHPNHEIARKQATGFGGVVSFKIKGGYNEANNFFKNLKIFQLADSLGGVESLANYSTKMTHESFPVELKKKIGITDNLIRLSIGIEDAGDLIEDLKQALD